jgi:hypothetical protein
MKNSALGAAMVNVTLPTVVPGLNPPGIGPPKFGSAPVAEVAPVNPRNVALSLNVVIVVAWAGNAVSPTRINNERNAHCLIMVSILS